MNARPTALHLSLLDRISAGIAAITPEMIVPPCSDREQDRPAIVVCDDYLKRMFTYHHNLVDEVRPLETEMHRLYAKIAKTMVPTNLTGSPSEMLKFMFDPSDQARNDYDRLKDLEAEVLRKKPLAQMVGELFWLELHSRHSELAGKTGIKLCTDWSIVELTDAERAENSPHHGMFAGDDLEGLLSGAGDSPFGGSGFRMHIVRGDLGDMMSRFGRGSSRSRHSEAA